MSGKKKSEGAFPGDTSPAMPWLDDMAIALRSDPNSYFFDLYPGYLSHTRRKGRRAQTKVYERMDYAVLDPCVTAEQLFAACDNAKLYKMRSIVVQPDNVALCVRKLYGVLDPRVCAVIGFPFGFGTAEAKVREAEVAMNAGAHEITLVPNIGNVKNGAWGPFETEVFKVRRAVGKTATFNLVIDKTFLSEKECEEACRIARRCSVDFIQTSSGYGPNTVTSTSVALMTTYLMGYCGIIAAGGVNSLRKCVTLLSRGADRLLTPYAPAICEEELFENRVWREIEYNTALSEHKARRDPYVMRTFEREEYVRRRHEEYLESVKVIKSKMWSGEILTEEEKDAMHFSFFRLHTMGKRMGEWRGQYLGSACHRNSLPALFLMLCSSAPVSEMRTVRYSFFSSIIAFQFFKGYSQVVFSLVPRRASTTFTT